MAIAHLFDHTDRAIDQLVYQLYGLSDKEIALVEAATTATSSRREASV